ncbi:MAG: hypothetical protein ACE5KA_08210 [Nitrososphaerales archaeon]
MRKAIYGGIIPIMLLSIIPLAYAQEWSTARLTVLSEYVNILGIIFAAVAVSIILPLLAMFVLERKKKAVTVPQ